jgi:hypothetical protein
MAPAAAARAAPPNIPQRSVPRPPPPAPPSSGLAPPTVATAAYYMIGGSDEGALLVEPTAAIVANGFVNVRVLTLRKKAVESEDGLLAAWSDANAVIDCRQHRWRLAVTALANLERTRFERLEAPRFTDWKPIAPGSAWEDGEALMCNNRMASGVVAVGDVVAYGRRWQTANAAPSRPQGSANTSSGPGMSVPTAATAAYYMVGKSDQGSLFLRPSGAYVADGVVNIPMTTLLDKPIQVEGGPLVAWGDADARIDCRQHRWRFAMTRMANLERTRFEPIQQNLFGEWSPILPGTGIERGEALMCNNRLAPGLDAVGDLVAYARQQQAAGPPSRPTAPASSFRPDYRMAEVGKDGALIIDRASIRRQDDLATVSQLSLFAEPSRVEGGEYWWADLTVEIDCAGHRQHQRIDAVLTKDRTRRRATIQPTFSAWGKAERGSFQAMVEDYVCRGRGAENFDAIPDLDKFQNQVLAAIKGGAFK